MKHIESTIGRIMQIGTLLAFAVIIMGSLYYLLQHSHDIIDYQTFHDKLYLATSFSGLWHDIVTFSARGIIQLGLFSLVLVQILRVALTIWYFIEIRDRVFVVISLLILAVIMSNLVWRL